MKVCHVKMTQTCVERGWWDGAHSREGCHRAVVRELRPEVPLAHEGTHLIDILPQKTRNKAGLNEVPLQI